MRAGLVCGAAVGAIGHGGRCKKKPYTAATDFVPEKPHEHRINVVNQVRRPPCQLVLVRASPVRADEAFGWDNLSHSAWLCVCALSRWDVKDHHH